MLFRRIKSHIEKENWFAVFVDFCIVVVGVFIGIQVANWNESNAESRSANEMLANVLVDLQSEKATVNVIGDYWGTAKAYAETAIDGFNTVETVSDEQFVISAYQASQAIFPISNRATYEQMVASGNINIAVNNELRLAVISYYISDWAQSPDNNRQTPYRANIRRVLPHNIQATIRENCGDQFITAASIAAIALPKSCDLDLPDASFAETAAMLRARPDLLMDLRHHLSDLDSKLQNIDQAEMQLVHMLMESSAN